MQYALHILYKCILQSRPTWVFLTPHSLGLSGKQHPSAAPLTLEFYPRHLKGAQV
jgi:hypothetical protein